MLEPKNYQLRFYLEGAGITKGRDFSVEVFAEMSQTAAYTVHQITQTEQISSKRL